MGRDPILRTLVLAAVLTAIAGLVKPRSPDFLVEQRSEESQFYIRKTWATGPWDVVVMGDSRVLRAVSPSAMAKALPGRRIFNFAYNSGGLNAEMFDAAERRLDRSVAAPAIVLGVTPLSLLSWKANNEQYREYLATPRDQVWLALGAPAVGRFFQPLRPVDLLGRVAPIAPKAVHHYEYHDDGWIGSWRRPADPSDALRVYAVQLAGKAIDQSLVEELLSRTRRWRANGVRVVAFRPPATDAIAALEDSLTGFDEESLAASFREAGGTWLSFPNAPYTTYDGSHLELNSALAFSRDLARALQPAI